jgi:hypothetical protein
MITLMNARMLFPFVLIILMYSSCDTIRMAVPSEFASQATEMKVKGAKGKKLSFGSYKTTKVKRGWARSYNRRKGGFVQINTEDLFMEVFGVTKINTRTASNQKFHYDINEGKLSAHLFGHERSVSNNIEVKTRKSSLLELLGTTENAHYSLLVTILPETDKYKDPWKLVTEINYDREKDSPSGWFRPMYLEEKGYATNQTDSIFIRSFYVKTVVNKKGKEMTTPMHVTSGYELTWEGGIVCVIDLMGKNVWMYNDLEPSEKFILAAISSVIMSRHVGS